MLLGEVDGHRRRAARSVLLADGDALAYDYLIVAAGADAHLLRPRRLGARYAPGLKTLDDALEIRRRVLLAFERAERETDDRASARPGSRSSSSAAAPTGVELAGTLAEIARHTLRGDFRRIDPRSARVRAGRGPDRVLPPYPHELSAKARRAARAAWASRSRTGARVTGIDADGVTLGDGAHRGAHRAVGGGRRRLAARRDSLGAPLDRAGRVRVEPDLTRARPSRDLRRSATSRAATPTASRCPASRRRPSRWAATRP